MQKNPWLGQQLWAFDTETHLIQPGLLTPPIVCGSWAVSKLEQAPCEGIVTREAILDDLEQMLLSPMVIVGANVAYDFGVACAARPYLMDLVFAKYDRGEVFDVLIAEALIDIHKGLLFRDPKTLQKFERYSLAIVTERHLAIDISADKSGPDAWRLKYALLDGIPLKDWPQEALDYPIRDARYTCDVAIDQIADGRNLLDMADQARAAWALHLAAVYGMRTDAPWVEAFSKEVEEKHHLSRARFLAAGLLKVKRCSKDQEPEPVDAQALKQAMAMESDLTRTAELIKALEDIQEGRAMRYGGDKKALERMVMAAYQGEPPRTGKGNVKANKDTLKESGDELLAEFAAAGENEKFFTTYLSVLKQGTKVPINPETNVLVATGRTSYRKPNLQNMPRGGLAGNPREGFIARPGTVMASLDYPTLELRTLAHALEELVGESAMAEALRAPGTDLHVKLAAGILNQPYSDVLAKYEAKDKQTKDFRQMAKAGNFGLPGGLGAVKFIAYARDSYDARLCLLSGRATQCGAKKFTDRRSKTSVCSACFEVANEIKKTWFQAWPEMEEYFRIITRWTSVETEITVDEDGEEIRMDTGSVVQLISGRVRGRCNFTNGANTIFQGLAADVAKRAMWMVQRECYTDRDSPLWGSRLLVFVHDELFMELPEERAHEAAFRAAHLMNEAGKAYCPSLPWDVRPALARRWYKGMEEVYSNGRLVPWEPKVKVAAYGRLTESTESARIQLASGTR